MEPCWPVILIGGCLDRWIDSLIGGLAVIGGYLDRWIDAMIGG